MGERAEVAVLLLVAIAILWPAKFDPAISLREWLNRPSQPKDPRP